MSIEPNQAKLPETAVTRIQKIRTVLIILGLTLLAVWGTLELGLRHFYQVIPLDVCASDHILGNYYCQPYYVYDKPIRIGYRYQPNLYQAGMWDPADPFLTDVGFETRPSDRNDAFWYIFETDEMGFPNSESEWRDKYDIIVTGDSFTTRTAPQTWIELLGKQTGKSILTLGASSWSTINEVEAVKLYGLDKKPEWIILLYFEGNDLLNVAQYVERRDSGLDWREYDMQDVVWYRRLVTYHLFRYWLKESRVPAIEPLRYRYPVSFSTEVGEIETVLKDVHLLSISADYDTLAQSDEFAHLSHNLLELRDLAAAQNTQLLVVFVPSKEHVLWSRIWDAEDVNNILERTVTMRLSDGDRGQLVWDDQYLDYATFMTNHNAQERLFSDFAQENGIEFLNLTPTFWQKTIAEGEFYHYADPHWNQAGNQLVADLIEAYLRAAE